ncbi:MAG TPA: carboxypeptidase-like regulatory domain-containing protein [Bacteroidia bacterium]|nr:carboxypeptidase-like regulatory domain-containing protein [Bacteroidia bacterium]
MNKRQNAKLNMYLGVQLFVEGKNAIWSFLLSFVAAFTSFKAKVVDLVAAVKEQEEIIKGYVLDKRNKRIAMCELANKVRSGVQAYATDQNNMVLYEKVNYATSKLMEKSSNLSRTRCQIIHDEANTIIGSLADYGLVPADLTALQTAIDDFATLISNPKDHIAARKMNTEKILKLISDIDSILRKKMDKLMENFKLSAPDFYAQYFNNRKIFDSKTNFTEIRATIINKTTGLKLEGVKMIVDGTDHDYEFISNTNGVADAKQIHPEIYDLKFELPGFEPQTISNIDVSPGEKELIVVELIPLP